MHYVVDSFLNAQKENRLRLVDTSRVPDCAIHVGLILDQWSFRKHGLVVKVHVF